MFGYGGVADESDGTGAGRSWRESEPSKRITPRDSAEWPSLKYSFSQTLAAPSPPELSLAAERRRRVLREILRYKLATKYRKEGKIDGITLPREKNNELRIGRGTGPLLGVGVGSVKVELAGKILKKFPFFMGS
ncbi:hypothetical protein EVAR_29779_1 [Eumeta japonica]|uniref:Uncharacterized protein n=1 Tax=Eumeta variegata TaxID=151549 RepID=A0A4C1WXU8_EUMVA|nr:hypothetical protein EVAR_29779_1 [Eumeta japonica]